jgi:radical SAM superfamily enzyme YgiQ (UPF0313 family)
MRILLINANALRLDDGRRWHETHARGAYAPTTLTTLASLVPPELEAEVMLVDETADEVPADFAAADLVGISAMTCDAPRAYQLADNARALQIPVVLGGYHATFMPQEAGEHADAVVKGFAEAAWPQLLRDFARGSMRPVYEADWQDAFTSDLPAPRRDLLRRKAYATANTIETSRGCANPCSFCVVPPMHQRRYVQRRMEQVAADIQRMPAGPLALLDANPAESPEFAANLFEVLAHTGRKWFAAASLKCAADPQWVRKARASGCRGLVIGFESLDARSLAGAGKTFNEVKSYGQTCRRLHDEGIAILGCFIFGFDGEQPAVFEHTVEFVDAHRIDLVLYSAYTPFPGTGAWSRLQSQKRILTNDWSRYDGRHVVFEPVGMTVDQLQEGIYYAWNQTYGFRSIFKRVIGAATLPLIDLIVNLKFRQYRRTFLPAKLSADCNVSSRRDAPASATVDREQGPAVSG